MTELALRETLLPFELDAGEAVTLRFGDGSTVDFKLVEVGATVEEGAVTAAGPPTRDGVSRYRFTAFLEFDGTPVTLVRHVPVPASFYEPWRLFGLDIWFDAAKCIGNFLEECHSPCLPRKDARFAVQESGRRICPEPLHPWCPLPDGGLRVEGCYRGEDTWLGPYDGCEAHGGLDINHPAGTPLWTPFAVDEHHLYNRLAADWRSGRKLAKAENNNRWEATRRWPDGSTWLIRSCHMIRLVVPEGGSLAAGTHYADGAGVLVGCREHSHFVFGIREEGGEEYLLDAWILFRQMYRDAGSAVATS